MADDGSIPGTRAHSFLSPRLTDARLDVVSFAGEEAISELYAFEVVVSTEASFEAVERELFAQPAALVLGGAATSPRVVSGIVRSIESRSHVAAPDGPRNAMALEIVPHLALLRERRYSRVFESRPVSAIVSTLLDEWGIRHRFSLRGERASWPYCVQYQETDFAFIERLLAAEGIFFHFEFPDGASLSSASQDDAFIETLVLGDSPQALSGDEAHTPTLPVQAAGLSAAHECIARFQKKRTLAPTSLRIRDYNPDNARFDVRVDASVAPRSGEPRDRSGPGPSLEIYDFRPERPVAGHDQQAAERALEQIRRRAIVYRGESNCRRLVPGHRFVVRDAGDGSSNTEYVATRTRVEGGEAWFRGSSTPPYQNVFEAALAASALSPPEGTRRVHHGLDTAVVTGPVGAETHTDGSGRVKVQFRWDLDRPADENSSCWIRVAQGWAGPGYGTQFLPRVGMEVLVGYLDGDVNRPIVVGCAPNSSNAPPFPLPLGQARTGIVTRSLAGDGHSELTFDDTHGREAVTIRAQRDLSEVVQRTRTQRVGKDDTIDVGRDQSLEVGRDRTTRISGNDRATVLGSQWTEVTADRVLRVNGQAVDVIARDRTVDLGADSRTFVAGRRFERVGGEADETIEGDAVDRLRGCVVTVVGTPSAQRSWLLHVDGSTRMESTAALELASEASIRLTCGESSILLLPDGVHIRATNIVIDGKTQVLGEKFAVNTDDSAVLVSKKVGLYSTDGASVRLTADAKVDGDKVKLKPGSEDPDSVEREDPPGPTTIRLEDQDGNPLPGERYEVVSSDGARRAGVTDASGEAVLSGLTGTVDVLFPELHAWGPMPERPDSSDGSHPETAAASGSEEPEED